MISKVKEKIKVISNKTRENNFVNLDYKQKYRIIDYILFFFIFSFIGWVWEVSLTFVQQGILVNRGVLLGPWLPIYGSGGVLILLMLKRFFDKSVITFFATAILCSVVEYVTSWYLEVTKGIRWWDYSKYLINLNGRICLEGAIIFGMGGLAIVYILAPKLYKLLFKISVKILIPISVVLIITFCIDLVYSNINPNIGMGVTDHVNNKNL